MVWVPYGSTLSAMACDPCKRSFPGRPPRKSEAHRAEIVDDLKPGGAVELTLAALLALNLERSAAGDVAPTGAETEE
jgi:hypothetical protein